MTRARQLIASAGVVAALFSLLAVVIHGLGYENLFDFWGSWLLAWELFWGWFGLTVVIAALWLVMGFGMERIGLVERDPK